MRRIKGRHLCLVAILRCRIRDLNRHHTVYPIQLENSLLCFTCYGYHYQLFVDLCDWFINYLQGYWDNMVQGQSDDLSGLTGFGTFGKQHEPVTLNTEWFIKFPHLKPIPINTNISSWIKLSTFTVNLVLNHPMDSQNHGQHSAQCNHMVSLCMANNEYWLSPNQCPNSMLDVMGTNI